MDNKEQLAKLGRIFNSDKIVTNDDLVAVLKGVLEIMNSFKKGNEQLSEETKKEVTDLLAKVETFHEKQVNTLDSKINTATGSFDAQVAQLKALIAKVKTIKPVNGIDGVDGKDANPEDVVPLVMAKIELPKYKETILDGRKEIVEKINTGKKDDTKIELKQIEGLDKIGKDLESRALSILDQRTQFLINKGVKHDTTLSGSGTDADPLTVIGGGGGASTLAQVSTGSTDTAKSLYTMTSTVDVEFKNAGGTSVLKLNEAAATVGIGNMVIGPDAYWGAGYSGIRSVGGEYIIFGSQGSSFITNGSGAGQMLYAFSGSYRLVFDDTSFYTYSGLNNAYDLGISGTNEWRSGFFGTSLNAPLINGGTAANGDITINGTSSATKTTSYVILQDTGGNVGIGTTAPTGKLHIHDDAAGDGPYLHITDDQTGTTLGDGLVLGIGSTLRAYLIFQEAGILSLATGNRVDDLVINSSGNVGIGTTAPNTKLNIVGTSGDTFMHVQDMAGTGKVGFHFNYSTYDWAGMQLYYNSPDACVYFDNGYPYDAGNQLGNIYFRTTPVTIGTLVTAMTILGGGNVGIGTTAPSQPLDVNGAIKTNGAVYLYNGAVSGGYFQAYGGVTSLSTQNSYAIDLSTDVQGIRINGTTGNVGIGTTGPVAKFVVNSGQAFLGTNTDDIGFGSSPAFISKASGSASTKEFIGAMYKNNTLKTGVLYSSSDTFAYIQSVDTGGNEIGLILGGISSADVYQESLVLLGNGNVGVLTSPTAKLHIAAGTATANTAPLKFTSGTLNTTAEAGAVEFLTDAYYATTTTGAVRRMIVTGNTGRATGQTAANASVATYTLGATDASFEVSANVLVTTSSAEAFTVTVDYTDEGNTARTITLNFQLLAGTIGTAIAFANGAVPYEGIPVHIRVKASTTITVKTAAGGTYTGATYNAEAVIRQIG